MILARPAENWYNSKLPLFYETQQPTTMKYTGQILDENMKTLANVNVNALGGTISTQTDKDGKFSINLPGPKTPITISYMGYITETENIEFFTQNSYLQLYPSAEQLSEVVIRNPYEPKTPKNGNNNTLFILLAGAVILYGVYEMNKKPTPKSKAGLKRPYNRKPAQKAIKVLM